MSDQPAGGAPAPNGAQSNPPNKDAGEGSKKPGKQAQQPKTGPDGQPQLSGAELKKLQKAEKAARRAREKEAKQGPSAPESSASAAAASSSSQAAQRPSADSQSGHRRSGSSAAPRQGQHQQQQQQQQQLPTRRRPSQSANAGAAAPPKAPKEQPPKQVSFLTHLYVPPRRHTTAEASKDVHPTILLLAQQTAHHAICGSQARTVATLLALKTVISTYTTPPGTSLPRHLSTHFLSPQLTHLKAHGRPFCTAQSAAVRWLKNAIATLDPALPEHEAKARVLAGVDTFVRDRFAVADRVIAAEIADAWIRDDDVVLVFGNSAVVGRALREAVRRGRRFRVVVADARPLHEGAALARSLRALKPQDDSDDASDPASINGGTASSDRTARKGSIHTTYTPLSSLSAALSAHPPTRCLLGAHTVLNDGAVQARCGTALVALLAHAHGAPVLVAAESAKFSERVAVGALGAGGNEVGAGEALVLSASSNASSQSGNASQSGTGGQSGGELLKDTRLSTANLLYDTTPASLISVLVTELGSMPPGAAPAVLRTVGGVAGDAVA